jgi:hypothetical protein
VKGIWTVFMNQFRSGEIWRRAWGFSKFKRYGTFNEWKKDTTRTITVDDVPAIALTLAISIGVVILFTLLFKGRALIYAILGAIFFFRILQGLIERFQKRTWK